MKTFDVPEPVAGQLPARPAELAHIEGLSAGDLDNAAVQRMLAGKAIVIGGLSLIGEQGAMVAVVGIIKFGTKTDDGTHVRGWSLHLGHPDESLRQMCYFDTEHFEEEGSCPLPLPNCMVYFVCEADPALAEEGTEEDTLTRIVHFVVPFISDSGPPKGIDW